MGFAVGQNIIDTAGNALTNTTPTGTNHNSFTIDNTAPTVTSISRDSGTGVLTIVFSEQLQPGSFVLGDIAFTGSPVVTAFATSDNITWTMNTTNPSGGQSAQVTGSFADLAGNVQNANSSTVNWPAGVAGSPINLALTDPAADHVGAVTVTIAGVPSGWSLSEGTDNGDGTWTVQTNDIAALTITSPRELHRRAGAQCDGTWTNADGSTGNAFVADNVEVYAPGTPIFACRATTR